MATTTQIRQQIKAILQTVPNAGVVHDHEPYTKELPVLRALYVEANQPLHGWFIRRTQRSDKKPYAGRKVVRTRWACTLYFAVDEGGGSELVFDELLDAAVAAFAGNQTLNGLVDTTWLTEQDDVFGLQIDNTDHVMFAGVLCHRARCVLFTKHHE